VKVKLTGWWYLSFVQADEDGSNERFIGACLVEGDDLISAVTRSHSLSCNPGGSVMGLPVPEGYLPDREFRERLLSKSDVLAFWPDSKRMADIEREERGKRGAS
jgi:hypothetical protein